MSRTTLRHDGLIYGSDEAFLDVVAPFLRDGIARGDGVVVATDERKWQFLAAALGARSDDVVYVPSSIVYESPVAAIRAYDSVLTQFRRAGRRHVRAIGEVKYGDEGEWLRYESIAHEVFAKAPLHVVCPYDVRALPERLIEHARVTHPQIGEDGAAQENARFVEPALMLRVYPGELGVDIVGPPGVEVAVQGRDIAAARAQVAEVLSAALDRERSEEALLAIGEVLANGIRHGRGAVRASLWTGRDAVMCSVRNDGLPIEDPLAGYRPPGETPRSGMGLWIARQLADGLSIGTDERGPVVTLLFRR